MRNLVSSRQEELAAGGSPANDILSLMIRSSEDEGKYSMNNDELVGFWFICTGNKLCALTEV